MSQFQNKQSLNLLNYFSFNINITQYQFDLLLERVKKNSDKCYVVNIFSEANVSKDILPFSGQHITS